MEEEKTHRLCTEEPYQTVSESDCIRLYQTSQPQILQGFGAMPSKPSKLCGEVTSNLVWLERNYTSQLIRANEVFSDMPGFENLSATYSSLKFHVRDVLH